MLGLLYLFYAEACIDFAGARTCNWKERRGRGEGFEHNRHAVSPLVKKYAEGNFAEILHQPAANQIYGTFIDDLGHKRH